MQITEVALNTMKLSRVEYEFLMQFPKLQVWLSTFYARPMDQKASYRLKFVPSAFELVYSSIQTEIEDYANAVRLQAKELGRIQHLADRLYREAKELRFQVETIKLCK